MQPGDASTNLNTLRAGTRGDLIDGLIGQHYLSHWLPERVSEIVYRFAYETASRMALRSGNLSHAHRVARKIS